jgi:hypothetical protein
MFKMQDLNVSTVVILLLSTTAFSLDNSPLPFHHALLSVIPPAPASRGSEAEGSAVLFLSLGG